MKESREERISHRSESNFLLFCEASGCLKRAMIDENASESGSVNEEMEYGKYGGSDVDKATAY